MIYFEILRGINHGNILVIPAIDAVCRKYAGNHVICKDGTFEDRILAVWDIQENLLRASTHQCFCHMREGSTAKANIVYDKYITPRNFLRSDKFKTFDFAISPIPILDAMHILSSNQIWVAFRGTIVRHAIRRERAKIKNVCSEKNEHHTACKKDFCAGKLKKSDPLLE